MNKKTIETEANLAGLEERFLRELASLLKAEELMDLPEQLTDETPEIPDLERWRW